MSGRKNVLLPYKILTDGDMSTASLTSSVTEIKYLDDIGIQLDWTGSPVGSFAIQISADHKEYPVASPAKTTTTGNWTPLTLTYWNGSSFVTDTSVPTSLGSPIFLDLALLSAPYIRVVYTKGSGSGTLQITITAKEIGG